MFRTLKQLTSPTNKDLRQRIRFTLLVLLIYAVGVCISVPGTGIKEISDGMDFLARLSAMTGGSLRNFSIFALGVSPYISASIITQLLQMDIIPYFSELKNQGPVGRQKMNKITRYMGIAFAFIQGFAYSFMILGKGQDASMYLYVSLILTAGTSFLLWLGDQVTQKGLGNGISLFIMAGIIFDMPYTFGSVFNSFVLTGNYATWLGALLFALFVLIYIVIIIGVIFVQEAERKIQIQYANKTTIVSGNRSYMPVKINSAGVIPVIFASSLFAIPATIAQFVSNEGFINFVNNYLNYSKPFGFVIYILLIYFFSYVYTFIQIKPEELAKNLNEAGGFIPGIRPGKDTEKYISKVLSRLTFVGGLFIAVIAAIPIIFGLISGLESAAAIAGTSLLIVVGVALETYKQLEGSLVSRNYKKGYSRR